MPLATAEIMSIISLLRSSELQHQAPARSRCSEPPSTLARPGRLSIPKVEVDGQLIEIAPRLPWYDYALAAWPFALVVLGGALRAWP